MVSQTRQIVTAFQRLTVFWRASQWQVSKEIGLNPTQGEVLTRVDAQPVRAADLASMLGISQASLSDTVSALVKKGLVDRSPDPDDGRARQVAVTDKGHALAMQMPEAPEALQAAILDLSEAERGALLRSLMLIIRSLQQARAIPVQRMCVTCSYFRPHVHGDVAQPHHCAFVDAAFGDAALRLDCADHQNATEDEAAELRARFSTVG